MCSKISNKLVCYDQSTFFALAAFRARTDGVHLLCSNSRFALVAQWIAHQTSNLGVAGSNPVERGFFLLCLFTKS